MKKINKKDIITFIIIFAITCIIFIPFLVGHYASDTYNIANVGYKKYAINWSLIDGRFLMAIIGLIASKINISINLYVIITLFLALLISNINVMILRKIIKKYKTPKNNIQEIIITTISYITIFNFMYLENLYFVESIVMATSILLYILSANILIEKNKNYIVKSTILAILGVMCYQGTIGLFFVYVSLFTILKNKNNIKHIILDIIKSGIIALIAVATDLILIKVIEQIFPMKQTRINTLSKIPRNIAKIISGLPYIMMSTCNLFPENLFLCFLDVLSIIVIIYQIKKSKEETILYQYLPIVVIGILASSVTYILALTGFSAGRLRNALGALVGVIFILLYVETELFEKKGKLKILNILTYATLILYTIINTINYESIILQHKAVNILEKEETEKIDAYISQYEEENNIKVTEIVKIPIGNDIYKTFLPGAKNNTSLTHNALKTNWAADGVVNFYTKRNLKTIEITEEHKKKYIENAKKELDYQCIEDVLYINVYCF